MVGGLFKEKEKTEGARGKISLSSPLSLPAEQGRRPARRRRPWAGGLGARRPSGSGGKGRGARGESFPPLDLGGGGLQGQRHGSGRRPVAGVFSGGNARLGSG